MFLASVQGTETRVGTIAKILGKELDLEQEAREGGKPVTGSSEKEKTGFGPVALFSPRTEKKPHLFLVSFRTREHQEL